MQIRANERGTAGWRGALRVAPLREVFGMDLRTLALFRILLGLYLLLDLALRARDLAAHYTDFGIMPRDVAISYLSPASFSLHLMNGSLAFQAALFLVAGGFALMLVLGWRSRLAVVASWLLLLSLQNRNTTILSGEDNLALLMLFWAMFLPLGARFSVDAALDPAADRRSDAYFSVATLALLVQGMSMYFFSALLKSDPVWMPEGTAVYYALNLDYFATRFALWFRQFEPLLTGLTYYVWILELVGPLLIFSPLLHRPLRLVLIICFVTMHLGFWLCLEIGLFPLISIIMNLAFLPGWVWDRGARAAPDAGSLTIWYDSDCGFCLKMCRLIVTFLGLRQVPIRPAQGDTRIGPLLERSNSWVVTDARGDHLRWDAMQRLIASAPLLRVFGGLMARRPVVWLGDHAYGFIATHRRRLSTVTESLLPMRAVRLELGPVGRLLAGGALVFVTVQNVSTLPGAPLRLPEEFREVRQLLGLYQNWTMFGPHPERTSPLPEVRGILSDGTVVDVYNRRIGEPGGWPEVPSAIYENYRWRKFLSQMEDQSYEAVPQRLALNYARYLCRSWDPASMAGPPLATLTLSFYVEWTPPPGRSKDIRYNTVWTHECFG